MFSHTNLNKREFWTNLNDPFPLWAEFENIKMVGLGRDSNLRPMDYESTALTN